MLSVCAVAVIVAVYAAQWPLNIRADKSRDGTALLIIDVQECFLSGGSLAVDEGDEVIPVINQIRQDFRRDFSLIVLSQDWHCPDHISFASQHANATPFSRVNLTYDTQGRLCQGDSVPSTYRYAVDCGKHGLSGDSSSSYVSHVLTQTLWPDHCVKNVTWGPTSAALSHLLTREDSDIEIQKGDECGIDSYSVFWDNGGFRQTTLHSLLQEHGVGRVVVTGLALDYCVYYTSLDGAKLGYEVMTVTDASRGVDAETTRGALEAMEKNGILLVTSGTLEARLRERSNDGVATVQCSSSGSRVVLWLVMVVGSVKSGEY